MPFFDLQSMPEKELVPGFKAKFIHTKLMTFAFWDIKAGALLPEHCHPHEQVATILEGTFELTVDGDPYLLTPGSVVTISSNAVHSGRAVTDCRIQDVFSPVREDYI